MYRTEFDFSAPAPSPRRPRRHTNLIAAATLIGFLTTLVIGGILATFWVINEFDHQEMTRLVKDWNEDALELNIIHGQTMILIRGRSEIAAVAVDTAEARKIDRDLEEQSQQLKRKEAYHHRRITTTAAKLEPLAERHPTWIEKQWPNGDLGDGMLPKYGLRK